MAFFSQAFLDFIMKESKKRRRKQQGKLMAKFSFTAGQFAQCPAPNEPPALCSGFITSCLIRLQKFLTRSQVLDLLSASEQAV